MHSGSGLLLLILLLAFAPFSLPALAAPDEQASYPGLHPDPIAIRHLPDAKIRIDGRLDEPEWQLVALLGDFYGVSPDTLEAADLSTRVRFFYTDAGLYVSADMDQDPATLLERLSSRDQGQINRDYFSFTLDTSGNGRYGFWFQLNLGGSVSDGTLLPEQQYSRQWDGAWHGATARSESGWTAEMFIPWSILSMPEEAGDREMAIYVSRNVAYRNQRWGWPGLPFTRPKFMSVFQRIRLGNVNPRQQWAAYPYASSTLNVLDNKVEGKAGLDFFWRPSSNLQLNTTLNPDFGNVEADDVIVNLTAFETFFPEKRLFFQEGHEIFVTTPRAGSSFGSGRNTLTLLHTRRIGGAAIAPTIPTGTTIDANTLSQPSELMGAAKVSGQAGRLRYGVLAAFERDSDFGATIDATGEQLRLQQDGRDFGVLRLLYEAQPAGGYGAVGMISTTMQHPTGDAWVHGVDLHHLTPSGRWQSEAQLLASTVPDAEDGFGGFVDLTYNPRRGISHSLALDYFDEHLDINDVGFLRRNDSYSARYRLRAQRSDYKRIRDTSLSLFAGVGFNQRDEKNMAGLTLRQKTTLNNLHAISLSLGFSPERFEDLNSFGDGSFRIKGRFDADIGYETDSSRRVWFGVDADWLQEDLGGDRFRYRVKTLWRPTDRLTLDGSVRFTDRNAWLLYLGERNFTTFKSDQWSATFNVDLFLSARQQIRMALQWVGLKATERNFYGLPNTPGTPFRTGKPGTTPDDFTISDANFQLRYRWEIAPLSDLFVVYTRGASLPNRAARAPSFSNLFSDAIDMPLAEQLVVKLRYRLDN